MELVETEQAEVKIKEESVLDGWEYKEIRNIAPLQRGFDLPNSRLRKGNFPVVYSNGIGNYHSTYMVKGPGVVTGRSGTLGKVNYVEENYFPHNTSLWVTDFKGNYPLFIYYIYSFINLEWFGTGSGVPTLNRNDVHSHKILLPKDNNEQKTIATALSDVDSLISSLDKLIAKKKALKQGTMQQLLNGGRRLETFQNEEGYKLTIVGSIPMDWSVISLGDIFTFKNGLNKASEFFGYGTPIVNYMDVFQNYGLTKKDIKGKVSVSKQEMQSFSAKKGDVYFTRTSETVDEIGISAVLLEEIPNCVFSGFILRGREKGKALDNSFKKYCFSSSIVRKQIISTSSYTTRALTNGRLLSAVYLPLAPTLAEQRAIATILSDMDAEIEALEKKKGKYQSIKSGMMQELLTGKTRLV